MVGCTVVLIPWILYLLTLTLPQTYVADDWPATWIGFDILLVAFMLVTVVLGHLRRQLLLFADVHHRRAADLRCVVRPHDRPARAISRLSVLTALLAELPLAIIMIRDAVRILRLTLSRLVAAGAGDEAMAGAAVAVSRVQARVGEFVEQRRQLIDQLVRARAGRRRPARR